MEFVIVRFEDEDRGVVIDGASQGQTDEVLEVERGTHEISLDPPSNFKPPVQTVVLRKTTPLSPKEVTFAKK